MAPHVAKVRANLAELRRLMARHQASATASPPSASRRPGVSVDPIVARVDQAISEVCDSDAEGIELLGHAILLAQEVVRLRGQVTELELEFSRGPVSSSPVMTEWLRRGNGTEDGWGD